MRGQGPVSKEVADDWYGPETATFGDRLAAAREMSELTQDQLARRLGVKVGTLRNWENDVAEPRANRLQMLAGLLNVSISWLLLGESEGLPEPEVFNEMPDGKSVTEDGGWYANDVATFGDRVRLAREELGITPEDLARKIGVKKKTLLSWEDDLAEPRANRLLMLSHCLGVSLRWLLTGEDEAGRRDQDRSASAKT
ncbi:helix-turn-helix domain-containing protein [Sulfitobacter mediterraneus]|uniref:helix-turn-helix domain-containing protein n=2 Tax=Sulfitobacter mediterraneus TaxID=83219 RepID=UPI0035568ECB